MSHPDPSFPVLHRLPAQGWINDPNGLSYVGGRYHVFYQFNPHAPVHDRIAWGHSSSADLVTWREEPVALRPRAGGLDAEGCWSGCVTFDRGMPIAVYTAVDGEPHGACVVLAGGDATMTAWEQGVFPVAGMPSNPEITDVRDPFVFSYAGRRYLIQGAGNSEAGPPRVLLYDASDLQSLRLLGDFLHGDHPVAATMAPGHIWECPNLVQFGERWVLILSLWRNVGGAHSLESVRYLVGDIVPGDDRLTFEPVSGGTLDTGPTFYAPQVLALPDRVLLWSWAGEQGRSQAQIEDAGWAGSLTFPRVLGLDGTRVVNEPAPELDALRQAELPVGEPWQVRAFDAVSSKEMVLCRIDENGPVSVLDLPLGGRIMVDGSMVEAFPAGEPPHTMRVYPTATTQWLVVGAEQAWTLGLP